MARNPIPVRLPDKLDDALREAAKDDDRNLNQQVRRYVRDGLARDGYLPAGGTKTRE